MAESSGMMNASFAKPGSIKPGIMDNIGAVMSVDNLIVQITV
jgi:hypothetical protein